MRKRFVIWLGSISLLLAVPADVPTQAAEALEVFSLQFGLLLGPREASAGRGRRGFGFAGAGDPVRGRLIDGTLPQFAPEDGQPLEGQEGWQWKRVEFDESGAVRDRGSYLYAPVASDVSKVLVLNASGHSEAYVNGQPRGGDIYNYGYVHLPILLDEGANHLLFHAGRGSFKVGLYTPPAPVFSRNRSRVLTFSQAACS